MKLTSSSFFLSGFYFSMVLFWLTASFLHLLSGQVSAGNPLVGIKDPPYNYIYAFAYSFFPLVGGFLGLRNARKWGFFKSAMGKAIVFFSLGLITWGFGEVIWSYYNFFLNQEIPYPSWADASFILSWPLWSIGTFYLAKATGVKYGLKKIDGKLLLITVPIFSLMTSYYLLVMVARGGSFQLEGGIVKIFFDLAYPLGDVIILTLAFLVYGLSLNYLGGRYKLPVLITLLGFVVNYIADFGFSYTTTVGTFYNGNWVDLMFATAMFLISFGVLNLDGKD